ncbi:MAG: hypothetical protein K6348_03145, partial [Deferribacterales bacterium]
MKKIKSLKFLVWFLVFYLSFVGFALGVFLSLSVFKKLSLKQFDMMSNMISSNLNKTILEIMNRDFKQGELKRFIKEYDGSNFPYPYIIEIFSMDSNSKKFIWFKKDDVGLEVVRRGDIVVKRDLDILSYGYPIKLTENCLSCDSDKK